MNFLQPIAKGSLEVRFGRSSGTAMFFSRTLLDHVARSDTTVSVVLPDQRVVKGKLHRHPQTPYIAGRELAPWIKTFVPDGQSRYGRLTEEAPGVLRIEVQGEFVDLPATLDEPASRVRRELARTLKRKARRRRRARRRALERWERDPTVRRELLKAWPHECQVDGCRHVDGFPAGFRTGALEVHHLTHVAAGGSDEPDNLTLICANHHRLLHTSGVAVEQESAQQVIVALPDGSRLELRRPAGV